MQKHLDHRCRLHFGTAALGPPSPPVAREILKQPRGPFNREFNVLQFHPSSAKRRTPQSKRTVSIETTNNMAASSVESRAERVRMGPVAFSGFPVRSLTRQLDGTSKCWIMSALKTACQNLRNACSVMTGVSSSL